MLGPERQPGQASGSGTTGAAAGRPRPAQPCPAAPPACPGGRACRQCRRCRTCSETWPRLYCNKPAPRSCPAQSWRPPAGPPAVCGVEPLKSVRSFAPALRPARRQSANGLGQWTAGHERAQHWRRWRRRQRRGGGERAEGRQRSAHLLGPASALWASCLALPAAGRGLGLTAGALDWVAGGRGACCRWQTVDRSDQGVT